MQRMVVTYSQSRSTALIMSRSCPSCTTGTVSWALICNTSIYCSNAISCVRSKKEAELWVLLLSCAFRRVATNRPLLSHCLLSTPTGSVRTVNLGHLLFLGLRLHTMTGCVRAGPCFGSSRALTPDLALDASTTGGGVYVQVSPFTCRRRAVAESPGEVERADADLAP